MSYELKMQARGDTLHVRVTGPRTRQVVLEIAREIFTACAEKKTSKVLTDVRELEGRLPTGDAYDIPAAEFPRLWPSGAVSRVAVVDLEEFASQYRFFENVARNRGFDIRFFGNYDDAIDWLDSGEEPDR